MMTKFILLHKILAQEFCYFKSLFLYHLVDRWRVLLRGENDDYINAVNINVRLINFIIGHLKFYDAFFPAGLQT